ncbi:UNVERIFIED_CONTAM: hypothetical protein K2H54_067516, partial [Gekko kuhli]
MLQVEHIQIGVGLDDRMGPLPGQSPICHLRRFSVLTQDDLPTERPTARVARKKGHDDLETLVCELYGFYPKEIDVTWMKDEEDRMPETLMGGVAPNLDGTYNTWRSIKVDPKEKDRYRCQVGHDSLPEPLNLAWEEPASSLGLIWGIVGAVLAALILMGAGVAFYLQKRKEKGYEAAS